jgi:hypothetical protein
MAPRRFMAKDSGISWNLFDVVKRSMIVEAKPMISHKVVEGFSFNPNEATLRRP